MLKWGLSVFKIVIFFQSDWDGDIIPHINALSPLNKAIISKNYFTIRLVTDFSLLTS
ncbi:MAG: hypothetical protein FWD52_00140 [Candidatus Bathyarchaeota archaeon]|nr:hypothetical protein [Candidatus Termiticorpusculum sp.]